MKKDRGLYWVIAIVAAVTIIAVLIGVLTTPSEKKSGAKPVYLFSQTASSATIEKQGDLVALTLQDVSPLTLCFSESPFKITKTIDTKTFVENWTTYFKDTEPNTALAYTNPDGKGGGLDVGTITSASYKDGNVIYVGRPMGVSSSGRLVLGREPFPSLPAKLGASVVVIDSVGMPEEGAETTAPEGAETTAQFKERVLKDIDAANDAIAEDIKMGEDAMRDFGETIQEAINGRGGDQEQQYRKLQEDMSIEQSSYTAVVYQFVRIMYKVRQDARELERQQSKIVLTITLLNTKMEAEILKLEARKAFEAAIRDSAEAMRKAIEASGGEIAQEDLLLLQQQMNDYQSVVESDLGGMEEVLANIAYMVRNLR